MSFLTPQQAFALAVEHHGAGRLAEAEAIYRQLLHEHPAHPEVLHRLGVIALQVGRYDEADELLRRAIAANPAEASYHGNLGVVLTALGCSAEAVACLRRALELRPDFADAHYNLGKALAEQRKFDEALAAYGAAIQLRPDLAVAHNNLGTILQDQGRTAEATAAYRRAIEIEPHFAEAHGNLGNALKDQGRLDEAIAELRRAIELQPLNPVFGSNLILALQYAPATSAADLAAEHQRWNARHAAPLRTLRRVHANPPEPERRLRVGYVSADLRAHVVGRTLLPCFEAHDRSQFELVCYSGCAAADSVGERFRCGAALWREAFRLSDEKLAETIREDRIDILVDLSLHTSGHRLPVFARRPAPVQISWLGYPGTTGMEGMDFRISDPFLEAPGFAPAAGDEQPLRLPGAWCCYPPLGDAPTPAPPPVARQGFVTFGSFQSSAKINPRVLERWAEILRRVAGSRLVLLSRTGRSQPIVAFLEQHGVAPDRVEFLDFYPPSHSPGGAASDEYLRRYARIDIALDSFPYNGMTTTGDALWMGVPVVALVGATPISRASFSLLSQIGLPELAAATEAEYAETAVHLARDVPRLAALRATLRERMKASSLLDARRFTRHLEAAYRTAWQQWCAGKRAQ